MYLQPLTIAHLLTFSTGIVLAVFPAGFMTADRHVELLTVVVIILLLCLFGRRYSAVINTGCPSILVLLSGFLWGLYLTHNAASSLLPSSLDDQLVLVEGDIVGLPRDIESFQRQGQQFDLVISQANCINACKVPALKMLRLRWYGGERVKAGQRWQFTTKLRRPRGLANFAGRDYEVWLVQQGISATGNIVHGKRIADAHGFLAWRESITHLLEQELRRYSQQGILQALINGNNAAIDRTQWDIFSTTNTTHLFVISGLHLSLMGGLWWWIFRRSLLRLSFLSARSIVIIAAILAWFFAAFYAFLAGWAIPVQRALAVFSLLLLVFILRRSLQPLHTYVLLLSFCLFADALVLLSISFWLSWLAAAVLIFALTGRKNHSLWSMWWRSQWSITLGLAPLMILALGQISLLGLFANALAIPLVNLIIVPLNILALFVFFISPAFAHYLWAALNVCLDYLLVFLAWLVEIGGDLFWHPSFQWPSFFLLVAAVLIGLLPKGLPCKPLALLCLLPLLFTPPARIADNELQMTVFDVGQGLAVLIRVADKVLLYDTGPKLGENSDAGEQVILPYLYKEGIRHIDYLVVSHADMDHAGGVSSILKNMSVGQFLAGEALRDELDPLFSSIQSHTCTTGSRWIWQQFGFEFINPESQGSFSPLNKTGNNRSCVLRIFQANKTGSLNEIPALALLPGDIERPVEYRLMRERRADLRSELLIIPHHGSQTSSSTAFVKAVNPDIAIVSSGYRHRFGHPNQDIVQRYRRQGSSLLNTADSGAISLSWREGQWQIDGQARRGYRYFWQQDSF